MRIFDKLFGRPKKQMQQSDKVELMNPGEIWYSTPTISNEFPQTAQKTKESQFDITIHEDDFRQREFLNESSLSKIEEELTGIRNIWSHHSKKHGDYTLFDDCHVRRIIGTPDLKIPFDELKAVLECHSTGQVNVNGEILLNGFAIQTYCTTYFGILNGNMISELFIAEWNDNSTNEILKVNDAFNLVFVNWPAIQLIKND